MVKTIALICISGIVVGVAALIIVLSVMNGFNQSIGDRMLAVEPHLVFKLNKENTDSKKEDKALEDQLLEEKTVQKLIRVDQQDVILRTIDGRFSGAEAKGYNSKDLQNLLERVEEFKKNRPNYIPVVKELKEGEVIVGIDLARNLNVFEGDELLVIPPETLLLPSGEIPDYERVTVVSILSTELQSIDGQVLFYDYTHTMRRLESSASMERRLELRLHHRSDYVEIQKKYQQAGYEVDSWVDRNAALFFALKMERWAMTVFLSLAAIITSFSILTVLILLMTQKRQDIGILMSLGLSLKQTKIIFMQLGMMLSAIGLGGGILLGLMVSLYLQWFPLEVLPDIYYDATIPATVDFNLILTVFAVAALISLIGSWLPVHLHLKMSPSEALRR